MFQLQPFHFCVSDLHYLKDMRKLVKYGGFLSKLQDFLMFTFCCWQGQPANMNGADDQDGTSFPSREIQRGEWKRRIRIKPNMSPIPVTRRTIENDIVIVWIVLLSIKTHNWQKVTIKSESGKSLLYAKKYTSLKNVHHRRCLRCWLISAKSNNQKWKWRKSAITARPCDNCWAQVRIPAKTGNQKKRIKKNPPLSKEKKKCTVFRESGRGKGTGPE